jgi:hypothetical protein
MTAIQETLYFECLSTPHRPQPSLAPAAPRSRQEAALIELAAAEDDLTRLSTILNEAFGELLNSFGEVQSIAQKNGHPAEMDLITSRAIMAIQCEDLASQLIGFTQKRLVFAREALKIRTRVPQTRQAEAVHPVEADAHTDRLGTPPVRQDALHAGSAEFFQVTG